MTDFITVARQLALQASSKVIEIGQRTFQKSKKKDKSWVTEADLESDRILRDGLVAAFPDHAVLTEETGLIGREGSDWTWLIDPLDGTKAYANGISGYSVMVGLLKEGRPYLGVVVDPVSGFIYEALRGTGTYLTKNGVKERVFVSKRNDFSKMPLVISPGFPEPKLKILLEHFKTSVAASINSVGIKVGFLVRQEADVYINYHSVHYWDTCAPLIILEEAGGTFTRLDGERLSYDMKKTSYGHDTLTIASNGTRHDELRNLTRTLAFP